MDDRVDDVKLNELSVEHEAKSDQDTSLLEEIKDIDQKLRDPNYKTYKKSTYWHQQPAIMDEVKQETFQKELIACLLRIEALLTTWLTISDTSTP